MTYFGRWPRGTVIGWLSSKFAGDGCSKRMQAFLRKGACYQARRIIPVDPLNAVTPGRAPITVGTEAAPAALTAAKVPRILQSSGDMLAICETVLVSRLSPTAGA
jgi:hypothetical protein